MAAKQKVVNAPRVINSAGVEWKIRRKKDLMVGGEDCDGVCIPDNQEIILSAELKGDRLRRALIHEAIHAALVSHRQYYDENLTSLLEDRLDELISLNPDLMRMYGYVRPSE